MVIVILEVLEELGTVRCTQFPAFTVTAISPHPRLNPIFTGILSQPA